MRIVFTDYLPSTCIYAGAIGRRVFSEWQTVAAILEMFEIPLMPEYSPIWKERFEVLVPGALVQFAGNSHRTRI
jgi:hypothetical protein